MADLSKKLSLKPGDNKEGNIFDDSNSVKLIFRIPSEDLIDLNQSLIDFARTVDTAVNSMLTMVKGTLKNQLINENAPTFETPVKRKPLKREVPLSSSINKVVLHRAKRLHTDERNSRMNSISRKLLNNQENDANLINQQVSFVAKESSLDIKPSKPPLLNDVENQSNLLNVIANQKTSPIRTRSRTRLQNKQKEMEQSSIRSNTTIQNPTPKKCVNNSLSTPKFGGRKPRQSKQVDSVAKTSKVNVNNFPNPMPSVLSTPTTMNKRPDLILKSSVEKVKKAEANRKAYLENKQQQLRERSTERKNRLLANQQKMDKVVKNKLDQVAKPFNNVIANPPIQIKPPQQRPQTPKEKPDRHEERLRKLNNLKMKNCEINLKNKNVLFPNSASANGKNIAVATESALAYKTKYFATNETKMDIKTLEYHLKQSNIKSKDEIENESPNKESLMTSDESAVHNEINPQLLSPIVGEAVNKTIHEANITFTAMCKTPIMNSTITMLKNNILTSYQMTPPVRQDSVINYDISALIDSEDDEEQMLAEKRANEKPKPKWATGRELVNAVRQQYKLSQEERNQLEAKIFSFPRLPVDLDLIGLPVHPKYQQRTSSVCWDSKQIDKNPIILTMNSNNQFQSNKTKLTDGIEIPSQSG
ncbi:hypothetical protein SSS_06066 [Sarcoptes scabiei]|uniref:Inner centromere protein ARK-binding domain-containing protein n=1 Tax=Sarcoptes scabiei TaxID=52283 RepID=A0A834VJ43_SARSC|nr:hypothetical protein SSS_06066 [Sarcoptes scabiei]UXI16346.1 perilipin-2 [Sarcoptes scabiei]